MRWFGYPEIQRHLAVVDDLAEAANCDLIELQKQEITTANLVIEAGQEYQVFIKVLSNNTRRDAAILTFSVDSTLAPEEAMKYFPRFTPAVGKPFAFIPNQSEDQNEGLTLVRFTAPPGIHSVTIGARRWASGGVVSIGKCLAMPTREDGPASLTTRYDLPKGRFCELVIDTSQATKLTKVEEFTVTARFQDARQRLLEGGEQIFRLPAYPGALRAEAALAIPFEMPAGAAELSVGISASNESLRRLVQITPKALHQPAEFTVFISEWKQKLEGRAAAVRACAAGTAPEVEGEVDGWLCSERAAVLQRAAKLFGPKIDAGAATVDLRTSLPVVAGTILEIRFVPVLVPELVTLSSVMLRVSFFDMEGKELPHAGHELSWSQWSRFQYPLSFEAEAFDEQLHYAAPHYVIVPPRAISLTVEVNGAVDCKNSKPQVQNVTVDDTEIPQLVQRAISYLEERSQFLTRLVRCLPNASATPVASGVAGERESGVEHLRLLRSFILSPPNRQVLGAAKTITSFEIPGLPRLLPLANLDGGTHAGSRSNLRIGVIGSRDFIYYLSVWHEVTPITFDLMQAARTLLPFDIFVLEQSDRLSGGWPQSFFGFVDGTIPQPTLQFVRALRERGILLVLIADPSRVFLRLIEHWACEVDWVVVSGPGAEDEQFVTALGDRPNLMRFPLLVETRLHRPVIEVRRPGFSVIYSELSDLFDFRQNIEYLERIAEGGLIIADRHWRLVIERVKQNLDKPAWSDRIFGSASTEQWAFLCRHSAAVVFFEESLQPRYKAAQVIAEAIANGAVAVYVGDARSLGDLAESVIAIHSPYELSLVLRQLRFDWHREQVWLRAFRRVHREFRFERLAAWLQHCVSGAVAAEPALPKVTMVTISKRPHLLDDCISRYRHQTYSDVEVIVVLNTDIDDVELGQVGGGDSGIRIYNVPKEFNIGYCLNMAISVANGKIWMKCDDDDFYGPHYVEDMVNAFHFSGADIVGKPQSYTYFRDEDAIYVRTVGRERERSVLRVRNNEFLTGASLSAKTEAAVRDELWFSSTIRMANDSEWVRTASNKGLSVFFSDRSNFVVVRSADVGDHTWSLSNETLRSWSWRVIAGPRYDLVC